MPPPLNARHEIQDRVGRFCQRFHLSAPVLLAPMAGACPPGLSAAVAEAGGMGACGALMLTPEEIRAWAVDFRAQSAGSFMMNIWMPEPAPAADPAGEAALREFLAQWGPAVPADAPAVPLPDWDAQFVAMLETAPAAMSSIMGLFPENAVAEIKARGIPWFATATTVREARAAAAAGADVIVAQGAEAGGHRGAFDAGMAERELVGLFALLLAIVDAVPLPVVAAGGIADGRTMAAALMLGASAVQIGTGFLRCPEAGINAAWGRGLASALPEDTVVTRAFSGRPGRSLLNAYVHATLAPDAPPPAPYPVQRALTAAMRKQAAKAGDLGRMQAWAGQAARLSAALPAGALLEKIWTEARALLA